MLAFSTPGLKKIQESCNMLTLGCSNVLQKKKYLKGMERREEKWNEKSETVSEGDIGTEPMGESAAPGPGLASFPTDELTDYNQSEFSIQVTPVTGL